MEEETNRKLTLQLIENPRPIYIHRQVFSMGITPRHLFAFLQYECSRGTCRTGWRGRRHISRSYPIYGALIEAEHSEFRGS